MSCPSLLGRSLLLQLARLLPHVSTEEKQIDRVHRRIQKIMRSDPDKCQARQVFVGELFSHLRSRAWSHSTRVVPKDMHLRIFKNHARTWRNTSLASQRTFEKLAMLRSSEKRHQLEGELERLRAQRDLMLQRLDDGSDARGPLVLSECGFTQHELANIGEKLTDEGRMSVADLGAVRTVSRAVPTPDAGHISALGERVVWEEPRLDMPEWAKAVCRHRDYFTETVFLLQRGPGAQEFWRFVYGVKSPFYLALSRLRISDEFAIYMGPDVLLDSAPDTMWEFHCNLADNKSAADVDPPVTMDQVFVIPHVTHTRGLIIATPCSPEPLGTFIAQLPDAGHTEPKTKVAKKADKGHDELVEKFPWLAALDHTVGFEEATGSASASDRKSGKERGGREEIDVDLEEAAMKALDAARDRLAELPDFALANNFKVRLLGGKWTMAHEARACSAAQGFASGRAAQMFSANRVGQKSMRFDVDICGQGGSQMLARAWCHRMQYFFDAHHADPTIGDAPFPAHIHAGYCETDEFANFARGRISEQTRKRVADVRRMCV